MIFGVSVILFELSYAHARVKVATNNVGLWSKHVSGLKDCCPPCNLLIIGACLLFKSFAMS